MTDTTGMLNRLATCAFALLMLAAAGPAWAQFNVPAPSPSGEDYRVEIGGVFWSPTPEVVIGSSDFGLLGDEIDFVQEFGIEKKRFTEIRATLKAGRKHKIRFHYIPFRYEEEATLQRRIVFGGQVFDVGLPAIADVDWRLWRIGYEWDFVSAGGGFLGLVTELKYNAIQASIQSPVGSAELDVKAPVPAIGLIGRGYLAKNFSLTGEFTGFKVPDRLTEEFDGEFWDWDLYATLNVGRNLGVQGGYRSMDVEYIAEQDLGRLKMTGWYFGGALRF